MQKYLGINPYSFVVGFLPFVLYLEPFWDYLCIFNVLRMQKHLIINPYTYDVNF
jgi:hypothetical protein